MRLSTSQIVYRTINLCTSVLLMGTAFFFEEPVGTLLFSIGAINFVSTAIITMIDLD